MTHNLSTSQQTQHKDQTLTHSSSHTHNATSRRCATAPNLSPSLTLHVAPRCALQRWWRQQKTPTRRLSTGARCHGSKPLVTQLRANAAAAAQSKRDADDIQNRRRHLRESETTTEIKPCNPQIDHMKDIHTKKRLKHVVEPDKSCETRVEDVAWLCSLSESEMDILISVKLLIIQRAKMIGCKELANKFSLKMIRAIALVLMEHLKSEIKDSSLIPNMVKSTAFLDACNLLKCNNEVDANIDELSTSLGADIQKLLKSPSKSKRKKQKVESSE